MQIVIFGATGSLGSHLVKQALDKGIAVKALTRTPEKMKDMKHPLLTILQGDVLHAADVEIACKGADAVLCPLAMVPKGQCVLQVLSVL